MPIKVQKPGVAPTLYTGALRAYVSNAFRPHASEMRNNISKKPSGLPDTGAWIDKEVN